MFVVLERKGKRKLFRRRKKKQDNCSSSSSDDLKQFNSKRSKRSSTRILGIFASRHDDISEQTGNTTQLLIIIDS